MGDSEVDMGVAVEDTEEVAVEAVVDIGMEVLVEETTSPEEETGEEERIPGRQRQASHLWQGLELVSTQPSTCLPRKLLIFTGCSWTACMRLPTFYPNDQCLSRQTHKRSLRGP